jgi:perosamine synthetase
MYMNEAVTYKYMPFNVQAALGYAQFQRLEELVKRKREIFESYRARLSDIPDLQLNAEPEDGFNSVWITAVVFGHSHKMTKPQAIEELKKLGVPARPFFYPLSSLKAYPGMEHIGRERNPVAYDISNRGINLSCAMNLDEEQIEFICAGIRTILGCK